MSYNYKRSLDRFNEINTRWDSFMQSLAEGNVPPEEEFIIFLQDLDRYWPDMYAIEQRDKFRTLNRRTVVYIDMLYRRPSNRGSALGNNGSIIAKMLGIKDPIPKSKNIMAKLDHKIHGGKPLLTLTEVIEKAG
ncbi:hypothetical protein KY346_01475 [Candidatus Woesearchaeota archaeon]|nr:hypothetical protein [Candidatus Woesearchaeota archaeon]